ncbi:MAG: PQQ-binding-like beta-propeller repeat protein [Bacteroidales bacterium]|nr:PQQ-binding-like beta-propeller repeat protein [Bacteroidales bacterium]
MYCFDKKNGKLYWKVNTGGSLDASPVLLGDVLLVANMRGDLMFMNASDGKSIWTYELGSPMGGNPAVIDKLIFVAAQDGRVYCFGNT